MVQYSSANKGTPDNRQPIQLMAIEYAHGGVMVSPYGNINWGEKTSNRAWIGYTFIYFLYMHNPQKTNPQKNQPTLQ